MSLKVKVYHECDKPSMLVNEKKHTWTTGRFWWTKEHTRTEREYQKTGAEFTCDECKSEYSWSPGFKYSDDDDNKGRWTATKRTYTWKKVQT